MQITKSIIMELITFVLLSRNVCLLLAHLKKLLVINAMIILITQKCVLNASTLLWAMDNFITLAIKIVPLDKDTIQYLDNVRGVM